MLLTNLAKTPSSLFYSLFYCRGGKKPASCPEFCLDREHKILDVFHVALYRSDTEVVVEGEVMGGYERLWEV
jgi:hypothetical protein